MRLTLFKLATGWFFFFNINELVGFESCLLGMGHNLLLALRLTRLVGRPVWRDGLGLQPVLCLQKVKLRPNKAKGLI